MILPTSSSSAMSSIVGSSTTARKSPQSTPPRNSRNSSARQNHSCRESSVLQLSLRRWRSSSSERVILPLHQRRRRFRVAFQEADRRSQRTRRRSRLLPLVVAVDVPRRQALESLRLKRESPRSEVGSRRLRKLQRRLRMRQMERRKRRLPLRQHQRREKPQQPLLVVRSAMPRRPRLEQFYWVCEGQNWGRIWIFRYWR